MPEQPQQNGNESAVILPRVKISSHATVIDLVPDQEVKPDNVVHFARNVFQKGKTRPLSFRVQQLKELLRMLEEQETAFCNALYKDLKKCHHESVLSELALVMKDIKFTLRNLKEWMGPNRPKKSVMNFFDGLYIYKEPYGVVLIIGAWNYPVHLVLSPLVGECKKYP